MTKLSKSTLDFVRKMALDQTRRPMGVFLFTNRQFPDNSVNYSITIDTTSITLSNGTTNYAVSYQSRTSYDVALELNNSPFPIDVRPLCFIQSLSSSELRASGSQIPNGFDPEDVSLDGRSCIVRSNRYAVQFNKSAAITVNSPYPANATAPWWGRISNGSFSELYKGIRYIFSMPEYNMQTWSSVWGKPFVDVEGETAQFVSANVIKLSKAPLLYKNNISILSEDLQTKYPVSIIKDVDVYNGYIYLHNTGTLPKNVVVSYTYLEENYVYKHINLNGHFSQNPYILDKYVVFYALPTSSSSGISRSRGIYHAIGVSVNDAIFNIQVENHSEPVAILGAINVRADNNLEDLNITDTRSFGGGLNTNELGKATQKKFKESQYFWDIGHKEGIPYPGAASVVVELPSYLKEVLTVSEIRERMSKYMAAGIYPVVDFKEEDYYDQFQTNSFNSDISLVSYSPSAANSSLNEEIFGLTGEAAGILSYNMKLPASGIYTDVYYTTGNSYHPEVINDILKLYPGQRYRVPYLKSSPDAIFSYEEKTKNGEWKRVTKRNDRTVGTGQISTQSLELSAPYGYKEIRNLTGFAPYVRSDDFWEDLMVASAKILGLQLQMSSATTVASQTGYISDILTLSEVANVSGGIGIDPVLESAFVNHDIRYENNFYHNMITLSGAARIAYFGTTGDTFPRPWNYNTSSFGSAFSGQYNALRDIHALARWVSHRINEVDEVWAPIANYQTVNLTGQNTAWVFTAPNGSSTTYAYSGAFNIARKVNSLSPFTGTTTLGTDIITPFYNPALNTAITLSGTYGFGEVNRDINNLYLGSDYIKSYAALYSAQVSPTTGDFDSHVSVRVPFSPRNVALSGLAIWTYNFSGIFSNATYNNTGVVLSWVTTFNKVSDLGATYLDNACNAVDYLYYGNAAWAGWTGYGPKRGTYYNATYSPMTALSGDTHWSQTIRWPDGIDYTAAESLSLTITGICNNLDTMAPYIEATANRGGLITPGFTKAVKYYLWYPTHYYNADPLFTGTDPARFVNTFEVGMGAILKGTFNEDGIPVEGGSYKMLQAPFSGSVPSELFDACARAIEYYRLTDNTVQENKWLAIAEGLFRSTQAAYAKSGGYPYDPIFTSPAAGDLGSVPLRGFLKLIGQYPDGPLTSAEFNEITGQIPII